MITLRDALEVVQEKYPQMRVLNCWDCDEAYSFSLVNRRWNGDPYDLPAGSTGYDVIKENGEIFLDDIIDEKYPLKNEITKVYDYLSEEDREFALKAKEMLKKWCNS